MRLNLTTQPGYPALHPLLPRRSFCPLEWADSTWSWNCDCPEEREENDGSGVLSSCCFSCHSKSSASILLCRWVCH